MSKDRDEQLILRFRSEQLQELVYYLEEEERLTVGEVVSHVREEEFTKAAMAAGELDFIRVFRRRLERGLEKRREDDA